MWSIVCNPAPAGTLVHNRPVGVLLLSLPDTKNASPASYSTGLKYILRSPALITRRGCFAKSHTERVAENYGVVGIAGGQYFSLKLPYPFQGCRFLFVSSGFKV